MPVIVQYMIYSTQRVVSCCKSRTALRAHINFNVLSSELTWTKHIIIAPWNDDYSRVSGAIYRGQVGRISSSFSK